jgi:hypothetical protein
VTLSGAGAAATSVGLASSLGAVTVPGTVTVAVGSSTATFTATAGTVATNQTATLTATLNGVSKTASVTVTAPPVVLSSLQCSPGTVASGGNSTCTVTLSGAGAAATSVGLTSSLAAVTVPGTVTVAAGASTATFTATAGTVATDQTATLTATLNSVVKTASLTVTAGTAPPTPRNIAPLATVTVSSESTATGQLGVKAVDGVIAGCPLDCAKEWMSNGEISTAWIRLTWSAAATISQVVLYDRPNTKDTIRSGVLTFSDGSSVPVGVLPNEGTAATYTFPSKNVTWVQFQVTRAFGSNSGLAEIQVLGTPGQ